MKEKLTFFSHKLFRHELISGSFYLFLGSIIGNILAFIFNLFLVRNLSFSQYAEINAIISLMTLAMIPSTAFAPIIVQFASRYFAKEQQAEASELFWQSFTKIGYFALILLCFFIVFSPILGNFLHIHNIFEVILAGIIVGVVYMSVVNTAFLQSLLKFQFLASTIICGGILKLAFGAAFLFSGLGIVGILVGYFLAFFIPFFLSFLPLKAVISERFTKKAVIHTKEIFTYGLPATIAVFSLSSFTSMDILLVKHFFPSTTAALYSGLSLAGRIIFYFSAPITTVMFPLVIKRFHKGESSRNLLYLSFLLVLLPSVSLSVFYFLFPKFVISFVLGKHYFSAAPYLGWFGLYLSIFSLLNVVVNFFLSIKKTSVSYFIAAGALLQIVGICLFHTSITSVVAISLILCLVLFIVLLLYYMKLHETEK